MPSSEVTLLWTVLVGTLLFFVLAGTIVALVVLSQRSRLREQRRRLEELKAEVDERRKAQEELAASEMRYRSLVENTHGMYCILDGSFRVIYASPNMSESLGLVEEGIVGRSFLEVVDPRDRKRVSGFFTDCISRGVVDASSTFRLPIKAEGTLWVEQSIRIKRDEGGNVTELRSVLRDVTERRQSETSLRAFSNKIIIAQETERRRVARELHDGIIQLLSSILFRLRNAEASSSKSKRGSLVKESVDLLEEAVQEVRRISHQLRPSTLDNLGLAPALRTMCEEFTKKTGIALDFRFPENLRRLSSTVELTVFRTIQEALNNIEKHSGASHATVEVAERDGFVRALVADNGRGFRSSGSNKAGRRLEGMGLEGIKERVQFLGGSFDVSSEPQQGVRICLRLPLKERKVDEL